MLLEDKIPVIIIFPRSLVDASSIVEPELETIKGPKGPFVLFMPEGCVLANIKDNEKSGIPTISRFVTP